MPRRSVTPIPPAPSTVQDTPLAEALGARYLAYALSTITARSLPDVRDGLKPVHRRLLYAMRDLRLLPSSPPRKSARVVGDVIGRYHPHGDSAVYDTLVRLAQDFAVRYPLVEGQGNFGNIDGDSAAAMRYTEARLTDYALLLLDGLEEDAVDLRPTYDGDGREPVVLPAGVPNLLANGSSGIAVGMATNIPPHNLAELVEALLLCIKQPQVPLRTLLRRLPGPDFPTGGVLIDPPAVIEQAYASGRGVLRLRARWCREELARGAWHVVVTEMPYQVAKGRLVERIAELLAAKKLPLLEDVRDESADDVRLVLVPRSRQTEPAVLMEQLFRQTELEARIGINLNVLTAEGVPQVTSLPDLLRQYLDHRQQVLQRRSRYRLAQIEQRLEILDGLLIAFANLDAIIRIIRQQDEPRPVLMQRFQLTEVQADAILNLRLRALRKLEEQALRTEHAALSRDRKELNNLLRSPERQWEKIAADLTTLRKQFGPTTPLGRRRTIFTEAPAIAETALQVPVEVEPLTVLLSAKGWVRALRGHGLDPASHSYKEGDAADQILEVQSIDRLLLVADHGKIYTLEVAKLPRGRGFGEPVRLLVDLEDGANPLGLLPLRGEGGLLLVAQDGRGFVAPLAELAGQTRKGRQVMNLPDDGTRLAAAVPALGDHVALLGENRKLLIIKLRDVPVMTRGRGVVLQRYKDGGLADVRCFTRSDGLRYGPTGREKTQTDLRDWLGERGQAGRLPWPGFPRVNRFAGERR